MFCYKCGAENPDEAIFCSKCGTGLSQSRPQQIDPQQPTKPENEVSGATDRAVYGCTKGCSGPVKLLVEILSAAVFTVFANAVIFWMILDGDLNSPWAPFLPFILFIGSFLLFHYIYK